MSDAVQIERGRAVSLFEALGYKTAGNWDAARLQNTLANIDEFLDDDALSSSDFGEAEEATLIEAKAAIEDGLVIEVVAAAGKVAEGAEVEPDAEAEEPEVPEEAEVVEGAEPEPEAEELKPKPKRGRKKNKGGKGKKSPETVKIKKPAKPVAKDKFGNREGTKVAKLCACLSKEPKSMRELMEAAGDKGTQYNVLNRLAEEGKIIKEEDRKYRLV